MPGGTGVMFHHSGYLRLGESIDFLREINDESSFARHKFRNSINRVQTTPFGAYEFTNCYVLGNQGLILDAERRVCWTGMSLGWEPHHVFDFMCQPGLFERTSENTVRCARSLLQKMDASSLNQNADACFVLPMPGFRVYGHWLIDLLPRLAYGRQCVNESRIVCTSGLAPWGRALAKSFGLAPPEGPPTLSLVEGARWESALAATTVRSERVLDARRARRLWAHLKRALSPRSGRVKKAKHVYVSRSRMATDRRFGNAPEIEAFFRSRGWDVIFPETLSLEVQAEIFADAEMIVGDDGSGLHNCIYAPPGTPVLVLKFNRTNLFHATLAQALDQPLAFLDSERIDDDSGGTYHLDLDRLETAIEALARAKR